MEVIEVVTCLHCWVAVAGLQVLQQWKRGWETSWKYRGKEILFYTFNLADRAVFLWWSQHL